MKSNRPVIAITHSPHQARTVIFLIKLAVWLAGGRPLSITSSKNSENYAYDALILGGGTDINPELYGKIKKTGYDYDDARDTLELTHLAHAEKRNVPVLGICRGCQLINIFRKGTLHIDITKVYEKVRYPSSLLGYIFFRKKIYIKRDALFYKLVKRLSIDVNSLHKQSIDHLGNNLQISAAEKNKIIQCIEDPKKPFFLGVQFHPEFLIYKRPFFNIFKILVHQTKVKD